MKFRSERRLLSTIPDDSSHLGGILKNGLLCRLREGTKNHKAESAGFANSVGKLVTLKRKIF